MPFPDALKGNPKVIFFTDFDGTITTKDTNDFMTDNHGFGLEQRRQGNMDTLNGEPFRDGFRKMLDSWTTSFPDTIEILKKNIKLDPHFANFVSWAKSAGVPIIVLSSGMVPIISALLEHLLGPDFKDIEIIANGVQPKPPINDLTKPLGWEIVYHDDSGFGHDKSLTIRPYAKEIAKLPEAERPTTLYAGDGVSDLSAAKETDLLFAKKGHDLITYCEREGIPFTVFEDWESILQKTQDIYNGKTNVKKLAAEGKEEADKS
ncbi:putative phosphoserine phosphatase [Phaeomoniella chlamydospora]|uniref:Putative phosphoserine phosphatase n=1 Tax=Phaeomoniella chlamydospora TaxID=158046 RepID=A0A0G2DXH7_PHACM|nr:putative phosphoserine phosphatase [Phaeomoniella chlamydospora]